MIDVSTDSNTVAKTYTWGLDLSGQLQGAGGIGGLLCVTVHSDTGDSAYYLTYDANGNVSEYVDDTDSVVAHYEYSPFGKLTSSGSKSSDFNHRFSTKYFDDETSLYYYGYRYYSNELGRWLSRDSIEEDGGVNLYCFLANAPVLWIDLLGTMEFEEYLTLRDRVLKIIEKGPAPCDDVKGALARADAQMAKQFRKKKIMKKLDKLGVHGKKALEDIEKLSGDKAKRYKTEIATMRLLLDNLDLAAHDPDDLSPTEQMDLLVSVFGIATEVSKIKKIPIAGKMVEFYEKSLTAISGAIDHLSDEGAKGNVKDLERQGCNNVCFTKYGGALFSIPRGDITE